VERSPGAWCETLIQAAEAKGEADVRGADHFVAQSIAVFLELPCLRWIFGDA
jgi:hypothetical protein